MTTTIESLRGPALPQALSDVGAAQLDRENAELRRQIMGFIVSRCIAAVTELGVPDRLAQGPRSVSDLARETGADEDALRRVLTALATEDVFREETAGVFGLTPRGALLCSATPGSLSHLCTLMSEEAYDCWGAAVHSLRTGRPAFDHTHGLPYFQWLDQHPRAAARFHRAQAGLVELRLLPLLQLDWSGVGTVVDVGAGDGALLSTLLTAQPHLSGVALDLPSAIGAAGIRLVDAGLAERAQCVAGDFFEQVPAGADRYVLAQILHDWSDGKAVQILRVVRSAMGPRAELLIVEHVVPDDGTPHPSRLLDLHMLALLGGRERTEGQWRAILRSAGFDLADTATGGRSSLLVARPVQED